MNKMLLGEVLNKKEENQVQWNLTDLATRSDFRQLLSVVSLYLCMYQIPCALGCSAFLLV